MKQGVVQDCGILLASLAGNCPPLMFWLFLLIRLAASFISWGIAFASPFVGGNIYVNVVISSCASVPAYPVSGLLTLR